MENARPAQSHHAVGYRIQAGSTGKAGDRAGTEGPLTAVLKTPSSPALSCASSYLHRLLYNQVGWDPMAPPQLPGDTPVPAENARTRTSDFSA